VLTRGKVDFDQFEAHANVRPCMYYCIMWFLLARISLNSSWGNRFESLLTEFPEPASKALTAADFVLVTGWEGCPLWP